ncbi:MAG: transporter, partial [Nitrospiraceae bacterium]
TGAVTLVGGNPNRISGGGGGGVTGGGKKKPGTVLPSPTSESGLGDIILRGRYYLLDERGPFPTIAITGRIKFPTADEDRGLGTGEFDKGFGMELTKKLVGNWVGFLDWGYTFIGDPPGLDLRNQWNYDFGVGYYFTKDLLGSFYYEEWRALVQGLSNPRDLLFAMNYKATSVLRVNASFQVGLSDGAPDYGLTGGVSFRF